MLKCGRNNTQSKLLYGNLLLPVSIFLNLKWIVWRCTWLYLPNIHKTNIQFNAVSYLTYGVVIATSRAIRKDIPWQGSVLDTPPNSKEYDLYSFCDINIYECLASFWYQCVTLQVQSSAVITRSNDMNLHVSLRFRRHNINLTGEQWGVLCGDFQENWQRYNGTTLYMRSHYKDNTVSRWFIFILGIHVPQQ